MSNEIVIDFSKLGGPLYTGRDRGEEVRKRFDLDTIDSSNISVNVVIPENTYSITSSFFLGLFGDSIRDCGEVDNFFKTFKFNAPDLMIEKFTDYAKRALREKKPLFSNSI